MRPRDGQMVQEFGEAGLDDRLNRCDGGWYGDLRCYELTIGGYGRPAL